MPYTALLIDVTRWLQELLKTLADRKGLRYLLMAAVLVTLSSGLLLYLVDPNIRSPQDGIWSAWVTMTHVGYGDVVPVSLLGRVLAALLILFGLALFSLFTATVLVALMGGNLDVLGQGMRQIEHEAERLGGGEDRKSTRLNSSHT